MRIPTTPHAWLALSLSSLLILACAAPAPALRAWEGSEHSNAGSCEDPDADQCIVFACDEGECGIFDCEDVTPEALSRAHLEHGAELARGYRPSFRAPGPHRNWRRAGLRDDARPRMTFHFRYRHGFLPAFPRLEGKLVKHHLFPQAREFREWFRDQGIDVHAWTMVIPEQVHWRIHGGTGRGGLWNEAWRQYHRANLGRRLTKEELLGKAFELAFRFDIVGPVLPYHYPVSPVGPQLVAP
ncbi:MAG TPA: TIGR02269 family lipoprotein [Myxococcaceae bacterium]|nr:TIGR02269 family lipoprotein [Myxococcaceae bacterium]